MDDVSFAVGKHYDENIFGYEADRLEENNPVEYAMMTRYIRRWIEPGSDVADVGVGVGHYSELLARRNCNVHLIDVSERLLEAAHQRLTEAGLGEAIAGSTVASGTNLECLDDESLDAILLLGPLYHLPDEEDRIRTVDEAHRVLREGGVVFATGINRMYYFRDFFANDTGRMAEQGDFFAKLLEDGVVDEDRSSPRIRSSLCQAHLTTAEEHRRLMETKFDEEMLAGVESFAGHHQPNLDELGDDQRAVCLDLIEKTAQTDEGRGASEHFVYVGRK